MKKTFACASALTLTLGLLFSAAQVPAFADTALTKDDITLEYLMDHSAPSKILEDVNIFSMTATYSSEKNAMINDLTYQYIFSYENGIYQVNEKTEYPDGYWVNVYYSSDPEDLFYYISSTEDNNVQDQPEGAAEEGVKNSLFGITLEGTLLDSVEETDDGIIASVTIADPPGALEMELSIDPENGRIVCASAKIIDEDPENSTDIVLSFAFDYSDSLAIDLSPKAANEAEAALYNSAFEFNTLDIDGNPVSSDIMKDASLVLVNYWEPWCGPCVNEMPSLEKLYEKYKDQGFLILGVFGDIHLTDDAKYIVESCNITYPILQCDSYLNQFSENFVPHSFFITSEGKILTDASYEGAKSFEAWEQIIGELGISIQ